MLIFLKRWLAYLLIPAGLVLLFVPLSTNRMGETEKDFLFLENSENLIADKSAETGPPSPKPDSLEDAVQQMNERRKQKALEDTRAEKIINPYGYPRINSEDLNRYPALDDAVKTMQRIWSNIPRLTRQDAVPLEEWNAFREAVGISAENNAFQYDRYIFKGYVKPENVSVPVEIKHLKLGCKVAGGLFLILGLIALCRSYVSPSGGIRVGRRSAIIIWDVIIVVVGALFTWWFLEFVLAKGFQTATEWGEKFAVGMGVFWVVLVYPVLALITTATSIQTLWITRDTIVLKRLFGATTVPWSDVESIRVSQAYSPRKVGGLPAPHRVMKILEISAGTATLRVLEPPYASTKKEIIGALMEHAPEKIKPSITTMSKEWLSAW